MQRPKIDFFVIGAARSGTTSIYRALAQHPEIFTPEPKEPRFFTQNWSKGWGWYRDIYAQAPANAMLGDFSPDYTIAVDHNRVVPRMLQFYPNARILYMVRNPIACAISNWRMTAEITGEEIPFGDALEGDWAMSVYHRSCFFRQITPFRQAFSDEQILAVPLEAMKTDPATWMAKVHSHIGVQPFETGFPKANASDRKPNRPGAPTITPAERRKFLDLVAEDARAMLEYMNMPQTLWNLSENSSAWEPAKPAADALMP